MPAALLLPALSEALRRAVAAGDLAAAAEQLRRRRDALERAVAEAASADARARLAEALAALRKGDVETERMLEERRRDVAAAIGDAETARRGLAGYAGAPGRTGSRIDERG